MNEIPLTEAIAALEGIVEDYANGDMEAPLAFVEDPSLILYIGRVLDELQVTA